MDSDGHPAPDDDRHKRPPSRWWRSRAESEADAGRPGEALPDEHRQQLADVGHELKSPLSIMLALCTRLEESGRLEDEDAADVARIRANAYTMLRRVQDLMLVARLENAGDRQLEAAKVDVAAVVRTSAEGFAELAAQRELDLRIEVPERLPAVADEEKLMSVVSNLMANAIRHAPAGGVVRCSLGTAPGRLVLQVADNGTGVAPDQRETIFERYRRGARSGGTGLGLAIVGEIVALHGGTVAVDDAPEGGALFTVELPLRTQRAGHEATTPQRSLALADRQKAIVEDLRSELRTAHS
ncbi:MAG TPA: HAMP domain-containing sensor histidine kinase [Baekduia sp.]|nr:HAMP domain-containing sensor histidine kinase [Baekduia sp.]